MIYLIIGHLNSPTEHQWTIVQAVYCISCVILLLVAIVLVYYHDFPRSICKAVAEKGISPCPRKWNLKAAGL